MMSVRVYCQVVSANAGEVLWEVQEAGGGG